MARFEPQQVEEHLCPMSAAYYATATNAAASVPLPAVPGECHTLRAVVFSYSGTGTLTGGRLTITLGGVTVRSWGIDAKGGGEVYLGETAAPDEAVVVTLAAGGADVVGDVNLIGVNRAATRGFFTGELDFGDYLDSGMIAVL